MPDMEQAPNTVQVATSGKTAFVRVTGCGSFRESPSLKQFGVSLMDEGFNNMSIDLSPCIGMDSTFMGVLVGLSMRLSRQYGRRLILTGVRPEVAARLKELGVDRVMDLEGGLARVEEKREGEPPPGLRHLEPLATANARRLNLEVSLAAHEDLCCLRPENRPKFEDVLAFLREGLKRVAR